MREENTPIMDFVNKTLEKHNRQIQEENMKNIYGIAVLSSGSKIVIRKEFFILKELWKLYIFAVEMKDEEALREIITITEGVFENNEVVIKLSDISFLLDTKNYNDSIDDEERGNQLVKTIMSESHSAEVILEEGTLYQLEEIGLGWEDEEGEEEF